MIKYTHDDIAQFVADYIVTGFGRTPIEKYREALLKKRSPVECLMAYLGVSELRENLKEYYQYSRSYSGEYRLLIEAIRAVKSLKFEELPLYINVAVREFNEMLLDRLSGGYGWD